MKQVCGRGEHEATVLAAASPSLAFILWFEIVLDNPRAAEALVEGCQGAAALVADLSRLDGLYAPKTLDSLAFRSPGPRGVHEKDFSLPHNRLSSRGVHECAQFCCCRVEGRSKATSGLH